MGEIEEQENLVLEAMQAARDAFQARLSKANEDSSYYFLEMRVGFKEGLEEKPYKSLELKSNETN